MTDDWEDDEDDQQAASPFGVLAKGDTLGRYLVLEQLGAGAMGVVYAAYDPELDRKIAVKVLRPHQGKGDPARRRERLVREAKAMAKVSHPNVGAIYDVGVHGDQVFLAMEFLAGGTLAQWLKARDRPWREIVAMFVAVGEGLAGAHAEGLIHRDFKPDNVLLDKNGVPKVVDFGLVRLTSASLDRSMTGSLDGSLDEKGATAAIDLADARGGVAALTRTGALTGTPAYMAAEQFMGKAADERTDQFAFCVALYEALYGERPFPGDTLIALADAVTQDRIKPAPRNSTVPGWVRGSLVRGLAADPARRYARFADLLQTLARDPAKRRRLWAYAGVGALAIAALAGGVYRLGSEQRVMCTGGGAHLGGIWEPGGAPSARKQAIQRAFSGSGKSYAQQAYASVVRLLDQYVGRWTGMYTEACQATHVRGEQSAEVLDLRMACLRERLGNVRALSDVFAVADGQVVENAVSAAASLPSLDRCADVPLLRAVVKPPEDPATRKHVDELRVELANMMALRDSGQCARAVPMADKLIGKARAVGYQPLLADVLFAAAQLGNHCGDEPRMLDRFKEAYATATGSRNDEVAAQAAALIPPFAINRIGQVAVANEWLGVARGAVRRLGHETLADAMLAQAEGIAALTSHEPARALEAAERSIRVTRRLLGPDDPLTIAWEANKGDWQLVAGQLDEALRTDIAARESFERVLGRDHPRVAMVWNNQGEVLERMGRNAEAEAAYQRSVEIFRGSGASTDVLAWALTGLGRARLGAGRPAAAVAPLEEALAIRIDKHVPAAQVAETRFALARALWANPETRGKALALAASARGEYRGDDKHMDEIETWLAKAEDEQSQVNPKSQRRRF